LLVLLLPVAVGFLVISYPLTNVIFGHGVYTDENVRDTAMLMMLHVIGIPGIAIQTFMTQVVFSMSRFKESAIISVSLLVAFVLCSVTCSQIWGLQGIALATGLSYTIGGVVYYTVVCHFSQGIKPKKNLVVLGKAALASAVMAAVLLLIRRFLDLPDVVEITIFALLGVVVYFTSAHLLHLKEADIKAVFNVFAKVK
jgi:putative peptidoglycan lipid II flippase